MEGGQIKGTFRWLRFVASRFSAYCLAHWVHRVPRCPPGRRCRGQAKTMQGNQPALQPKLALPQYHHTTRQSSIYPCSTTS